MKYYVYYSDDYADNGGVGFEEFDTKGEAEGFIEKRIAQYPFERNVGNYTVIEGSRVSVKACQTAVKVRIV